MLLNVSSQSSQQPYEVGAVIIFHFFSGEVSNFPKVANVVVDGAKGWLQSPGFAYHMSLRQGPSTLTKSWFWTSQTEGQIPNHGEVHEVSKVIL